MLFWWNSHGCLSDAHLAALLFLLLNRPGEKNEVLKSTWVKIKTGRCFFAYQLAKQKQKIISNLKIEMNHEKQKCLPHPFFPGSTSLLCSWLFYFLTAAGTRAWGAVVSLLYCFHSLNFSLALAQGPSHGVQSFRNCSNVGPFPWAAVLQEWHVSSHRLWLLPESLLQCGSHWATASIRAHPLGAVWLSAPILFLKGCWVATYYTIFFPMWCRGISAPVPGTLPLTPSLALVPAGLFLLHVFLTSLYYNCCAVFN